MRPFAITFIFTLVLSLIPMLCWSSEENTQVNYPFVMSCHSNTSDAGYLLVVTQVGHRPNRYDGRLSEVGIFGSKSLGTEPVRLRVNRYNSAKGFRCRLTVTQVRDRHGNGLILTAPATGNSELNLGNLDLNINGAPIEKFFRDVNCKISHESYLRLCRPPEKKPGESTES